MAEANALISSGVGFLMILDNPKMVGSPEMPEDWGKFTASVMDWNSLVVQWREEHLTNVPNLGLRWLNERLIYIQDRIADRL